MATKTAQPYNKRLSMVKPRQGEQPTCPIHLPAGKHTEREIWETGTHKWTGGVVMAGCFVFATRCIASSVLHLERPFSQKLNRDSIWHFRRNYRAFRSVGGCSVCTHKTNRQINQRRHSTGSPASAVCVRIYRIVWCRCGMPHGAKGEADEAFERGVSNPPDTLPDAVFEVEASPKHYNGDGTHNTQHNTQNTLRQEESAHPMQHRRQGHRICVCGVMNVPQ